MNYELFVTLYKEALEYSDVDMYIAERGWQDWMDNFKEAKLGAIMTSVYILAHSTIKETRESKNISRAKFSQMQQIPLRTIENWDSGSRAIPSYVKMLIDYTFFMSEFSEN